MMEYLIVPLAICTGIFFAVRFHEQDRGWGWGLLYGLFLWPVALLHVLIIAISAFFNRGGFALFEGSAVSYLETGIRHMLNEEYDEAIKDFDRASELDPQSPHIYEVRGRTYALQSRYDNAIADFNRAIEGVNENIEVFIDDNHELNPYYYRGLVWVELNEYNRAIEDFSKSIEFNPEPDVYLARAQIYTELRKYKRALEDYEEAISRSPTADAFLSRGRTHLNLGAHDEALNDFKIALKLDPIHPNSHIEAAAVHYAKGDFKKAVVELDTGISMVPDFMEIHADVLQELKQEEQMEVYDEVVKDLAGLYAARGVCYLNIKEYRKSIKDFDSAIDMDPYNASFYRGRGGTYSQLAEHSQAVKDLNVAIRLNPDDANAYFTRGIVHFNKQDFVNGKEDFDKAIELEPGHVDSYTGRGRCLLHLGQYHGAIQDLDMAISLEDRKVVLPDIKNVVTISIESSYAYAIRGLAYLMIGREQAAKKDFDKSISLGYDPSQIEEDLNELCVQKSVMATLVEEPSTIEDARIRLGDLGMFSEHQRREERKKPVTKVDEFTRRAEELHEAAKARGEKVYGLKPWYCSVGLIEEGAKVVFIGSRPAGNMNAFEADKRHGILTKPYEDCEYQAWLDDTHWGNGTGATREQRKVWDAFQILFGSEWEYTLRCTASFNVVASRFEDADDISTQTWMAGVAWCLDVLYHVSPDVIVCLGNGEPNGKSAWSIFRRLHMGTAMPMYRQEPVSGNYSLKHGRIVEGHLSGTEVIGLPQLYMPVNMEGLRSAAVKLGISFLE